MKDDKETNKRSDGEDEGREEGTSRLDEIGIEGGEE